MNQLVPFELESITILSEWKYDCPNDTCPICTQSLYEIPPNKVQLNKVQLNKGYFNKNKVSTSIIQSECLHAFHNKCLKTYLKKNIVCPLCVNTEFKFKKELEGLSTVKLFKA